MLTLKVIKLDIMQGDSIDEQNFTIGKIYTTDDEVSKGSVFVVDDKGMESALFEGEFEVIEE